MLTLTQKKVKLTTKTHPNLMVVMKKTALNEAGSGLPPRGTRDPLTTAAAVEATNRDLHMVVVEGISNDHLIAADTIPMEVEGEGEDSVVDMEIDMVEVADSKGVADTRAAEGIRAAAAEGTRAAGSNAGIRG